MPSSIRTPGARAPIPSHPGLGGPGIWRPIAFAGVVVFVGLLATWNAEPRVRHPLLPERTGAPDTSAVSVELRHGGGPVLLHLSGWATPDVLEEIAAAGLGPLEGYAELERLDSVAMNVVGGVVPSEGVDRIAALPYVLRIEGVP